MNGVGHIYIKGCIACSLAVLAGLGLPGRLSAANPPTALQQPVHHPGEVASPKTPALAEDTGAAKLNASPNSDPAKRADDIVTVGSTTQPVSARTPIRRFRLITQGDKTLPRHILKQFDFDEQKYGNHENVPMYWTQRKGPNLPYFNTGEFDFQIGHEAAPSFRLHAITDSVAFTYTCNDIPVELGNRYLITAWIRTQGLKKDQAYISAAYTTRGMSVLKGTEVFSEPIGPTEQGGDWSLVELSTNECPRAAQFLQITAWLAQPQMRHPQVEDSDHLVCQQDANVTAWFDDIEVTHLLPLPSIRARADVPVYDFNQPVLLTGPQVNPAHFGLTTRITVTDEEGLLYYQSQSDPRNLGQAPPKEILLDPLPSGLYTGRLQVLSQDRQITEQHVRFTKLPALPHVEAGQIGVCLDEATLQAPEATMACIRGMGACSVKIPIWTASTTDTQIAQGRPGAEELLRRVLAAGLEPVGVLVSPPEGMATRLLPTHSTIVDLFACKPQAWQPYLSLSLTHYADVMRMWQIGMDGQEELGTDARYPATADIAAEEIVSLVDGAQVALAWPAQETLSGPLSHIKNLSVTIPEAVRPEQIPEYISQYSHVTSGLRVTLQPLQERRYKPSVRRCDITRRIVFALKGGAEIVFAHQPWEAVEAGEKTLLEPTIEFTAIATLSRALAGKRYSGQFTWTDGTVFYIFAGTEDATLVAWNDQPVQRGEARPSVTLYLGRSVSAYDLRGRSIEIQGKDVQSISVGAEPILITGVDFRLAELRSLFDVQPRQVVSGLRRHQQTITVVNPYSEPINGIIRLRGPEGWEFTPSRLGFALAPGQTAELKTDVRIPYNEPIGPKVLTADLSIDSRRFQQISVPVILDLQLPGVEAYAFTDSTTNEVIVRHVVTNRTSQELNFIGSILLPDAGRQERLFLHMRPGQTMVKEYIIPRSQLQGRSQIRVNLKENGGSRVLNQMVEVY